MQSRLARAATVLAVLAGVAVAPAAPARAAQVCDQPPETTPAVEPVPWTQEAWDPATTVWPFSIGGGATVAVLDTGVQGDHPQLTGTVFPGADLLHGGRADVDCVPHGTALASIVTGRRVSGVGFRGLAPRARVFPVQVAEEPATDPSAEPVDPALVAQGIDTAVGNGVAVVLVGVVVYGDSDALRAAVGRALQAGVVVVAPVGDGHDARRDGPGPTAAALTPYPAAYDGVLGVGAVDAAGLRSPTSQVGSYVDLVAPGVGVVAAGVRGQQLVEGTEYAAAFVAAAAALVVGQPGSGLPGGAGRVQAVQDRLLGTAVPPPGALGYGAGALSPGRALTETVLADAPAPLPGNTPPPPDVEAEREAAEQAAAAGRSTRWALGLGAAAVVVALVALVVPRARRRSWRAGTLPAAGRETDQEPGFQPGDALYRTTSH